MSTKMTKTMKITYTAVFAAIATVLMYFEFPLPFMPPFLKIDLSGAVILIGAFIFGVGPGIAMAAIKDLIHVTQTQTAGTGELQDFLLTCTLIIIAVTFYRLHTSRKGAFVGCAVGTVVMSIVAIITNKLIILPFYVKGMGWNLDMIFDLCKSVNPAIDGMNAYLFLGVFPFTMIKGIILTTITMLVYKRLSVFIKEKRLSAHHPATTN